MYNGAGKVSNKSTRVQFSGTIEAGNSAFSLFHCNLILIKAIHFYFLEIRYMEAALNKNRGKPGGFYSPNIKTDQ